MELLIVELDRAYLGVPTADVKEVVRAARLAPAPGRNANIKGLLNLRGTVIPVVAVRTLLGLRDRDIGPTDHFIVLQTPSATFAVHVDQAVEILNVPDSQLDEVDNRTSAVAIPHAGFGVVQIHRGGSLWAQAESPSNSGSPGAGPRESNTLP